MRTLWQDFRYTLRQLRQAPVYALTAILTLALGLGAATAMLAVIDSVLIRPVALPHAERIVTLGRLVKGEPQSFFPYADLEALQRDAPAFEAFGAYQSLPAPVTTAAGTRVALQLSVLPGFFDVAGIAAHLGRTLTARDAHAPVAVVSDEFWQDNLHGDPHVLGTGITVEKRSLTVVGVLPANFSFPRTALGPTVYTPLLLDAEGKNDRGFSALPVVARLKPGVSLGTARAQAGAVYGHAPQSKDEDRGALTLRPYSASMTGDVQPALITLLGACALILLIACANTANLQLARAAARAGEIAVRATLGATRARILRQLATESVTVSLFGAGLGLLFAALILFAVRTAYGQTYPRFNELALHPAVFAACAMLAVLTGILAALAPAWAALQTASSFSQSTRVTRRSRVPALLVAVEIALTTVLLVTSGLFLRTFSTLERIPLGFDPHRVSEITLIPTDPDADGLVLKQTYDRLLAALSALPGVEGAATETSLPFSKFSLQLGSAFRIEGRPAVKGQTASVSLINEGFVKTMHAPLLQGRAFSPRDTAASQPVCLVNETFLRRYLRGVHPLGEVIAFTHQRPDDTSPTFLPLPVTIVGVLMDEKAGALADDISPEIYVPYTQFPARQDDAHLLFGMAPQFAVRSSLPQAVLERELRLALKQAAPDMAEMQITPLDASIAQSLTSQKLALRLASAFGLLALVLAAVGIYGVLSSSVAQRTRELGIRLALGSPRRTAMLLIVKQAAAMVALGLAVGLLCAWPAGRALRAFLYGVTPLDPLVMLGSVFVLFAVALAAAALPAWRAMRIDPVEALRAE